MRQAAAWLTVWNNPMSFAVLAAVLSFGATSDDRSTPPVQKDGVKPGSAAPASTTGQITAEEAALGARAEALARQGAALVAAGNYAGAEPAIREMLDIIQSFVGPDHPQLPPLLIMLANVITQQDRPRDAEPLLRQALAIQRAHAQPADYFTTLDALTQSLSAQARYRDAAPLYDEILAISLARHGERHVDTATAMANSAVNMAEMDRHAEAEALHRRALELRIDMFGTGHEDVAHSHEMLGVALWRSGRFADSEAELREAVTIYRQVRGDRDRITARAMGNLGASLSEQGRLAEALAIEEKVVEILLETKGERDPDTLTAMNNMAESLSTTYRFAEAEAIYRRILPISRDVLGPNHPDLASRIDNLGLVLQRQGRLEEAEPFHREALTLEPDGADVGINRTKILDNLASTLVGLGQAEEANRLLDQSDTLWVRLVCPAAINGVATEARYGGAGCPGHPDHITHVGLRAVFRIVEQGRATAAVRGFVASSDMVLERTRLNYRLNGEARREYRRFALVHHDLVSSAWAASHPDTARPISAIIRERYRTPGT